MLEEHADQNEVSTLYRGARPGSQNGQREQRWRRKNTQPMTDTVTSFCSAIIIFLLFFYRRLAVDLLALAIVCIIRTAQEK